MAKTTAQLINQDSGKTEYYTPANILEAASYVMGEFYDNGGYKHRFELDPASSGDGNQYVQASRFFDEQINGLLHSWTASSVWLNHPYKRYVNKDWISKAVSEYKKGNAKQICMIVWASTSEQWFHPLFEFPICFLKQRVRFIDPSRLMKAGATKSSAVIYMGPHNQRFIDRFSLIGHVMVPPKRQIIDPSVMQGLMKIRKLAADLLGHSQEG